MCLHDPTATISSEDNLLFIKASRVFCPASNASVNGQRARERCCYGSFVGLVGSIKHTWKNDLFGLLLKCNICFPLHSLGVAIQTIL